VLAALASNAADETLDAKLGFRRVVAYREQRMRDGRWTDVPIMDELLGDRRLG
jgi:L-amino acid N-acyltransferase YncA